MARVTARAATFTVHLPIEPHRVVGGEDHPRLQTADAEMFEAETVVWAWRNYSSGVVVCESSLHARDVPFCLSFDEGTEPDWVPKPPPEWDAAARDLLNTVRGVL